MGRKQSANNATARPAVRIEDGRTILRVGGVIQSVAVDDCYTPDVWDAMLPPARPANALILGLGGGTIATLMTQRWGALPITGVENDPAVAWLAAHEFGLNQLPNVHITLADAFAFVHRCQQQFEMICVDLYVAGKMSHGVLEPAFLRDIARILTPDGTATFNLWRSPYLTDQIRRIERILAIRSLTNAGDNVVVACARPHTLPTPSR